MVQFWYKLVKSGTKNIDDVPVKWREAVQALLGTDDE